MEEFDVDFWARVGREMNESPVAKPVAEKYARKFGFSTKTIYRKARRYGNYDSGKKQRADAGKLDPEVEMHLWNIAAIYLKLPDKVKSSNKESKTPLEVAVEMYIQSFELPPRLPSISRIHQIFRDWGISKRYMQMPQAKLQLKSNNPNHVQQYDSSVCLLYLDPDEGITPISKSEDYKNKEFGRLLNQEAKKKRRLVRHIVIDHYSGAFYVEYSFKQEIINYADFLYNAWAAKDDGFIFHGAPKVFFIDNDSGLRSHAMMRLYANLEIEVPPIEPYHAWVKGVAENFHRVWELRFESRFLHQKSNSLEQINAWAREYAIKFQKNFVHRRHRRTRFDMWNTIEKEQIREIPDYQTFQKLVYANPVSRKVNYRGKFTYYDRKQKVTFEYEVPDLRNRWVDVIVHPYLFSKNQAVTVYWPSQKDSQETFLTEEIQKLTVLPTYTNQGGFAEKSETAVTVGEFKDVTPTKSEKNIAKVKAMKVPELKPFDNQKPVDDIEFIPKTGTPIIPEVEREFTSITYKSLIQFKAALVDWLGRRLEPEEQAYIKSMRKKEFTQEDLEHCVTRFHQGLRKKRSQNNE